MEENLINKERRVKQELIDLISNSGLPAFLLRYMIKEMYDELGYLVEQEYREAQQLELQAKQVEKNKKEDKE